MPIQLELFTKPLTQKEMIYEYIKSKGRCLSHELNAFALEHYINCPGTRVRELKKENKVWHVRADLMCCIYPYSKEEAWSIYEADR